MPRFFVANSAVADGRIVVTGDDAHHITAVLRHKPGDILTVCDMARVEYTCRLEEAGRSRAVLEILSSSPSDNEPTVQVVLYQAMVKGDKPEHILQKAVELGVSRVVFFPGERSVALMGDGAKGASKLSRWQRISDEAAKQCGRAAHVPVEYLPSYSEALDRMKQGFCFLCYEGETTQGIKSLLDGNLPGDISFMIGPEGGFSPREIALAADEPRPVPLVTLGKRILRTETASGAVLTAIMLLTGNL